jgi:hypothetical protein
MHDEQPSSTQDYLKDCLKRSRAVGAEVQAYSQPTRRETDGFQCLEQIRQQNQRRRESKNATSLAFIHLLLHHIKITSTTPLMASCGLNPSSRLSADSLAGLDAM